MLSASFSPAPPPPDPGHSGRTVPLPLEWFHGGSAFKPNRFAQLGAWELAGGRGGVVDFSFLKDF